METESYWQGNFEVYRTCLFRLALVSIPVVQYFMMNTFLFRRCLKTPIGSGFRSNSHRWNNGFTQKKQEVVDQNCFILRQISS